MIKVGSIHSLDLNNRLFTIKCRNKIEYFYLQSGLVKKFQRYLDKRVFVEFDCNGDKDTHNNISARKGHYGSYYYYYGYDEDGNKEKRTK